MSPHVSGAPEAANNLVAYQQYAVFAADRLDLRPVIGGRDDDAACALHWFAAEGGDIFGADFEDFALDGLRTNIAEFFRRTIADFIEPVRLADLLVAGVGETAHGVHHFLAPQ